MSKQLDSKKAEYSNELYTLLCAGFPAVGKSHLYNHSKLKVLDSDSSKFDKTFFPKNYIDHIKANLGKVDIILISSHEVVREALVKEGLRFTLVYPNIDLKKEFIERYKQRGSPESFIKLVSDNWTEWITQLQNQNGCKKIELSTGQYLSDALWKSYNIGDTVRIVDMYDESFKVVGITKDKLLLEGDFSMMNNIIQEGWIPITDVYRL